MYAYMAKRTIIAYHIVITGSKEEELFLWEKTDFSLNRLNLKSNSNSTPIRSISSGAGVQKRSGLQQNTETHPFSSERRIVNSTQVKAVMRKVALFCFHFFNLPIRHQEDI